MFTGGTHGRPFGVFPWLWIQLNVDLKEQIGSATSGYQLCLFRGGTHGRPFGAFPWLWIQLNVDLKEQIGSATQSCGALGVWVDPSGFSQEFRMSDACPVVDSLGLSDV